MRFEVGKTYRVLSDGVGYEVGDVFTVLSIDEHEIIVWDEVFKKCRENLERFSKLKFEEIVDSSEKDKPAHYDTAIDTIDFMKANFSREAVEGFMRGNAIKYLQRDKGQKLSDLKKCRHYLDMLIELEEEQQ